MKAFFGSVVCAVAMIGLGVASVGAAAPQQAPTAATDKQLDSRIEQRIHDSSLKKYDIDVTVDAGVATLTGTVHTDADRVKAKQLATINGISRVDNRILVDPAHATTGTAGTVKEKTKEGAEKTKEGVEKAAEKTKDGTVKAAEKTKDGTVKAAEKTKEGAEKVADKTKEGLSKSGEVITDSWITTRVHSKFMDEDLLKGSDINVDTNDHVVTLKGTVMSAAGRARAVEQAKEVEGVHKVVDLLTIGSKKP